MNFSSFKSRYIAAACVSALLATIGALALAGYFVGTEANRYAYLVTDDLTREVALEARRRARALARHAADLAAPGVDIGDPDSVRLALEPLKADDYLAAIVITDTRGSELFRWGRPGEGSGPLQEASEPVRVRQRDVSGAILPQTIGEARVVLQVGAARHIVTDLRNKARALGNKRLAIALAAAGALGALSLAAALTMAWLALRRARASVADLTRQAERLGQGDYTRPVRIEQGTELAPLQSALERSRQQLRQGTIGRHYLIDVLSGMSDAVFVASPEGNIKIANRAACKLTGYAEEELLNRMLTSIIDETARATFSAEATYNEPLETVLRTRQGQTIPVTISGSCISSDDPQLQGTVFVARNVTDRKRAERRIRYLARYDSLTRVPNRMQFQHLLQQAIARSLRTGNALAMLYVDLDRFKEVNDTFGHASGDRSLEILSERLTRCLPKEAVAGRLAGDEFGVFVENLPLDADNRGPLAHLARSLLDEIGKPYHLNQHEVFLTASIGVAFCPRDAENVIDLIRNADAAMYHSKENGGNTFAFYSADMNAAAVERLMLKSKLRRALERDELVLQYQPKVDLRDGRIVGAEALLRWRLPGHGDIPPAQFIPLAEETNLILDIGEWVLDRVCRDYRELHAEVGDPGRISLNLSLKQLRQASFILRCRSVFRRHGVAPTAFELEITETTLMADGKRTVRLLDELYAMGLHLSIDDFGTGYSSLSALQQFPIGTLKIDRSFVREVNENSGDATIVRTIIDMGRSLGMQVVAEGVETRAHLAFLRSNRCQFGQGRLFGEPCEAEQLLALLASQARGELPFANLVRDDTATPESSTSRLA
ncbi:MAG: EAL domain-containing protein [Steroidobacteraceae bacterium]